MCPNLDPRFLPFIFSVLVLLQILGYLCQNDDHDQLHERCKQQFQCGDIAIGYPFSGGNARPTPCGRPGFELRCQDNIPLIDINSQSYRVLQIDNSTRILKVARDDLWNGLCPRNLRNTTFDGNLFDIYRAVDDQIIGLYYGCASRTSLPTRYPFMCNGPGMNPWSFFLYPPVWWPGCIYMSARVNKTAAEELAATTDRLLSALRSGFWIQWSAENDDCNNCWLSGGLCGHNETSGSFVCHCSDGPSASSCRHPQTGSGSRKRQANLNMIGVILGVAGILLSAFAIFYFTKQWRLRKGRKNFLTGIESLSPKRYSYHEIKKMTKSFKEKQGQGGYGIVYKGWLPDGQIVAVKVLTETNNANGEEFINEVASISRTSHVNIVNLLGFCYDQWTRALIYEFMPNKSLDEYICWSRGRNPEHQLEWNKLRDIAIGVARGLQYLHGGCNSRIIHFDIKPHNILLDKDFHPKISDFGLAKMFKKTQSIISILGTRGTIGYIAPEVCFRTFGAVSHKADVYSYGMVLLDMAGARTMDRIEATGSSENYFHDEIYEHAVLNNHNEVDDLITTQEDEETMRKMLLVGLWCIQMAPSDRPSMTKVVEMLEGSMQSIEMPPKPSLSATYNMPIPRFSSTFSIDVEIDLST